MADKIGIKTEHVQSITVFGRRWFARTYGNTYCSAEILVNGKHVAKIGPMYGYGDYWLQAAGEWLSENGYTTPEKYKHGGQTPLWSYCQDNKIAFASSVSDVTRERDL